MDERPIAVFDSGLGGISVLRALRRLMPEERFHYFGDSANAPYGSRTTEDIRALTLRHAERLFAYGAKALVVACNTATSAAINELRAIYPQRIVIGIEPALKPALACYPRGRIAVMATEATLREKKFAALMADCAGSCTIFKCPCPELVEFVERGELTGTALENVLRRELAGVLSPAPDAVVLGCTHFPFLKCAINAVFGKEMHFFDGAEGTAKETRRRLELAGLRTAQTAAGAVVLENSLNDPQWNALAERLLYADQRFEFERS